jgi:tRNA pseudouridine32 synthase/23S rRNA pseudouridine746 synthase
VPPFSPSLEPEVAYCPPADRAVSVWHADDHLVVVDKPAGLLTVPGRGADRQDCLVSRVARVFPDARIVHRLDMATSGLVVLGRGDAAQRILSACFHDRHVDKAYEAWVHGVMADDAGEIDLPLITDWPRRPRQMVCHVRGKPSLTRFQVLRRDETGRRTRVRLEPVTGRSHQLRVHLLAWGHPIVGDPLYGEAALQQAWPRLMLHACALSLPHPETGEPVTVSSPAPF